MAENFSFKLVSPTGVVFDGQVEQVTAQAALGEFGVLAAHTDYLASLQPGMLSLRRGDGNRDDYLVTGGLVEVREGRMTVLAWDVETPGTQDAAQAAHEAAEAERKLGQMSSYDAGFADVEHAMMLARARERAASFGREPH